MHIIAHKLVSRILQKYNRQSQYFLHKRSPSRSYEQRGGRLPYGDTRTRIRRAKRPCVYNSIKKFRMRVKDGDGLGVAVGGDGLERGGYSVLTCCGDGLKSGDRDGLS